MLIYLDLSERKKVKGNFSLYFFLFEEQAIQVPRSSERRNAGEM
jgi:hypothetical protein